MGITNRPISRGMLLGNSSGIVQNASPEDPQPSCLYSAGSTSLRTTPGRKRCNPQRPPGRSHSCSRVLSGQWLRTRRALGRWRRRCPGAAAARPAGCYTRTRAPLPGGAWERDGPLRPRPDGPGRGAPGRGERSRTEAGRAERSRTQPSAADSNRG